MECNYLLSEEHCTREPTRIIIWGCLNQHTQDFAACTQHTIAWITAHHTNQINCAHCYHPSADYITCTINNLNPEATQKYFTKTLPTQTATNHNTP